MEQHQIQIYLISDLIQKTYAELEKFQYSTRVLRKFKYSFILFEQYALKNDVIIPQNVKTTFSKSLFS